MRRFTAILAALLLLTVGAFAATPTDVGNSPADAIDPNFTTWLAGLVTATQADQLMMTGADGTIYEVHIDNQTHHEGKEDVAVGDWVYVQYNGVMTKSIPAQITAQKIECWAVTGVVSELTEEGFLLTLPAEEESQEPVVYQVNADAAVLADVKDGMTVTVFFNGVMTMSLPAQIFAEHIRLPGLNGIVGELNEDGFLFIDEDDVQWAVVIDPENTVVLEEIVTGIAVTVTWNGNATRSIPAQIVAAEVLPFYGVAAISE